MRFVHDRRFRFTPSSSFRPLYPPCQGVVLSLRPVLSSRAWRSKPLASVLRVCSSAPSGGLRRTCEQPRFSASALNRASRPPHWGRLTTKGQVFPVGGLCAPARERDQRSRDPIDRPTTRSLADDRWLVERHDAGLARGAFSLDPREHVIEKGVTRRLETDYSVLGNDEG